jgi:hypothetical protein
MYCSCTQVRRVEARKRKQSREPFFVVPAHKTVERKLGRERSRKNRSSSFLHTRPSSRNSEENAVERTVFHCSCTQDRRAEARKRTQSREPFFVVPAHKAVEQKLGRGSRGDLHCSCRPILKAPKGVREKPESNARDPFPPPRRQGLKGPCVGARNRQEF